jgi:hypothetical protein
LCSRRLAAIILSVGGRQQMSRVFSIVQTWGSLAQVLATRGDGHDPVVEGDIVGDQGGGVTGR